MAAEDDRQDAEQSASGRPAYPRIARLIAETPWAILPTTLAAILELVSLRVAGERLSDEEIRARVGAGPPGRSPYSAGAVAVLPLYGVLFPRANVFTEVSGGTSVQRFLADFRQAVGDEQVRAILIDVNSPGGLTDLIPEAAAEIRAARGTKPIVAIANTLAASAAYWLAVQADELVVTPSGEVGSIGVFTAHDDISRQLEMEGIKTTLISAGRFKTEGNPFEPLKAEAKEAIQRTVDEFYGMFVGDVAQGRRAAESAVRQGFGQGRLVTAKTAVELGMADRIDTFAATLSRLGSGGATSVRVPSRGQATAEQLARLRATLRDLTQIVRV